MRAASNKHCFAVESNVINKYKPPYIFAPLEMAPSLVFLKKFKLNFGDTSNIVGTAFMLSVYLF